MFWNISVIQLKLWTESWEEGKSVEEKDAKPTESTADLWGLSSKSIQEFGWTSQGMDWGWGQGIKSTTHRRVEEFGYSCRQRRLTWAKEKKNWTVAQGSKVLFSDESKFCISFGKQGPRVWRKRGEAHSPSFLKSSVKFPKSVMIWGAMSSAGVGPLCFLKTYITAHFYQEILEYFMLPSADQLFKDADFVFQQDLAPAHTAKNTKSWLNDHGVGVLDWPANSPDLNPRESMVYCQEENECRWAEGHCKRNQGFHTTSAVPQTEKKDSLWGSGLVSLIPCEVHPNSWKYLAWQSS